MNNKKNLLIPTLIISIALTAYIVLAATQSIHTPVTGGNYSGTITFNVSTNTTRCNACRNATIYYNSSGAINVKDKAVLTNLTTLTNNTANDVSFNGTISVTSLGDLPTYSFAALLDNGTKQNWTGVVSSITIDNTGPNVSINAPVNNLNTSSESLVLNATVNDSLSSVQAVYFNLTNSTGQQAFTNATEIGKNYNVTLNTSSYKDGSYVFTVYANDSLGNLNKTENITINIDSTVPSITLTKKDSGKHSLSITISVSDTTGVNGLCTTDRSTTVTGRSTTTQTTNESGLSCGSTYDYTVTCTDYVGNSNAATSSFTTSSCSGGGGGGTTSSYWGMTYAPNKEQVSEGYEKTMREKQRVRVSVNNREHYVGVLAVSENTATINVSVTHNKRH